MKILLNTDWSWSINNANARWAAALLPPHRAVVVACGGSSLMTLRLSSTFAVFSGLTWPGKVDPAA